MKHLALMTFMFLVACNEHEPQRTLVARCAVDPDIYRDAHGVLWSGTHKVDPTVPLQQVCK